MRVYYSVNKCGSVNEEKSDLKADYCVQWCCFNTRSAYFSSNAVRVELWKYEGKLVWKKIGWWWDDCTGKWEGDFYFRACKWATDVISTIYEEEIYYHNEMQQYLADIDTDDVPF